MVALYSYGNSPLEGGIALALYGSLLLMVLARVGMIFNVHPAPVSLRIPKLFHILLIMFLCARLTSVVIDDFFHVPGTDWGFAFVINRIASLLFLSSFSVMLFSWSMVFHTISADRFSRDKFSKRVGVALGGLNLIYYVVELFVIVVLAPDSGRKESLLYKVDMYVYVGVFLLLGLLFLIYGVRLSASVKSAEQVTTSSRRGRWVILLVAAIVFCLCFMVRCFIFSYHDIFGTYLHRSLFDVLGYLIPELFPSWFQLALMYGVEKRVDPEPDQSFIDDDDHYEAALPREIENDLTAPFIGPHVSLGGSKPSSLPT